VRCAFIKFQSLSRRSLVRLALVGQGRAERNYRLSWHYLEFLTSSCLLVPSRVILLRKKFFSYRTASVLHHANLSFQIAQWLILIHAGLSHVFWGKFMLLVKMILSVEGCVYSTMYKFQLLLCRLNFFRPEWSLLLPAMPNKHTMR
jgi:hypothetical protein